MPTEKIKLKNYTSSVPANRSIQHIEETLAKNGARQVLKEYDPLGNVSALSFSIESHIGGSDSTRLDFKLPVKLAECEKILRSLRPKGAQPCTLKKLPAQAERTAWKILSDWVDAQMALLQIKQVELAQVFVAFLVVGHAGQTLYEVAKENGFKKLLPAGK